jgi:hypothetical protein
MRGDLWGLEWGSMRRCSGDPRPHMTDMPPDKPDAAPSPEAIAADLATMLRTGVTVERCRTARDLLTLELVRAKAATQSTDDLAVSAGNLIREACAAVDGIATGATAVLLGVAPAGAVGFSSSAVRRWPASLAPPSSTCARILLLEAVADELYAVDSAYRLRHRHRTQAERDAPDSHLKIDWYEQHRRTAASGRPSWRCGPIFWSWSTGCVRSGRPQPPLLASWFAIPTVRPWPI